MLGGIWLRVLAGFATIVLAAAPVRADRQPWAVGITEEQKGRAQRALNEGNSLFLERRYAEALGKYEAAIAAWDHPAIRFNVVRCLIQLERIVEASDNLVLALKYGEAPLEAAIYQEALSYQKLFANQIAELTLVCKQPGVVVTLDGAAVATCPASEVRRVRPGKHQIVGVKDGLLTRTLEVIAFGGARERIAIELAQPSAVARIEHRWPTWIPWVVFGSGLAIAGAGVILDVNAATQINNYNRIIDGCTPVACPYDEAVEDIRRRGERQSTIAVGLMIGGGAIAAAGGVLLYLNRGRTVHARSVEVVPTAAPGGAAVSVRGRF